jgi:hypothetical protein
MPTVRPRHVITETEQVATALDEAARRWPEDSHNRRRLLLRLLEEGRRAASQTDDARADRHRDAVRRTSGALSGAYGEDYLSELRRDWPA